MIWYAALEWFGCIKVQRKGVFLSFTWNNTPGTQSSYHMAYVLSIRALIWLLNQTKISKKLLSRPNFGPLSRHILPFISRLPNRQASVKAAFGLGCAHWLNTNTLNVCGRLMENTLFEGLFWRTTRSLKAPRRHSTRNGWRGWDANVSTFHSFVFTEQPDALAPPAG